MNEIRYIYKIVNLINDKKYVGQTKNFIQRKASHLFLARKGKQKYLYCSMRKYGESNFKFEVIEECTIENVDDRERFWIAKLNSFNSDYGYNLTTGGDGGKILSDETRQLISQRTKEAMALLDDSYKERQRDAMKDPELRKLISEQTKKNTPRGHHLSDEMKKTISDKLLGRKFSDERRAKISERTREAMRLKRETDPDWVARQHMPLSEERKQQISDTLTGRKFKSLSEEHRKKISDANKLAYAEGRRKSQQS